MPLLNELILGQFSEDRLSAGLEDLRIACARSLQRPIPDEEFTPSLQQLESSGDIEIDGQKIRRIEPDVAEHLLEDHVEHYLTSAKCWEALRLDASSTVFYRTASGGVQDTGQYSRPDFTAATVRELTYDPLRLLDVITFELKNLAGATPRAALQVLEHTRFAQYSYLVCPKSRIRPSRNADIRSACGRHDVGLITFDIISAGPIVLRDFVIEQYPPRRTPDPYEVQGFLDNRFPQTERERLRGIAKGRA